MLPIPFNNPATYAGHSGVDYAGHSGDPIPASGPGKVVSRGRNDRGGFNIWVQYDGGPLVGYHHMNSHEGCPSVGERVTLGQRLGYVGWSGRVFPAGRDGAHLHSEVSGHATTAGYWRFFDRTRVVGAVAAGGSSSKPTPTKPEPDPEELGMDFICQTPINGHNGAAGWYRWICSPGPGTKRNIDADEYKLYQQIGIYEFQGGQSPVITDRYRQL